MANVAYAHIEMDEKNRPIIAGTRIKVIEVVLDRLAQGWDADEIHRQYPHLSVSQIESALAYYYDHEQEMNAEIVRQDREIERRRKEAGPSPLLGKLAAWRLRQ